MLENLLTHRRLSLMIVSLLVLGLALLFGYSQVIAQNPTPGTESDLQPESDSGTPFGDADENPVEQSPNFIPQLQEELPPGTEGGLFQAESEPSWTSDMNSPAPDDNPIIPPAFTNSPALTYSYYMVSGATLRGRSSSTTYTYSANGCVYATNASGSLVLNTELHIPDNAIIKYLRTIYTDTNANGRVQGYVTYYQPGATYVDLVTSSSSLPGAGGLGYSVSQEITHTVDNNLYAYTLIGWPSDNSNTLQICGLRVAYYAPFVGGALLPYIRR